MPSYLSSLSKSLALLANLLALSVQAQEQVEKLNITVEGLASKITECPQVRRSYTCR